MSSSQRSIFCQILYVYLRLYFSQYIYISISQSLSFSLFSTSIRKTLFLHPNLCVYFSSIYLRRLLKTSLFFFCMSTCEHTFCNFLEITFLSFSKHHYLCCHHICLTLYSNSMSISTFIFLSAFL
jgi:hypothetical protein